MHEMMMAEVRFGWLRRKRIKVFRLAKRMPAFHTDIVEQLQQNFPLIRVQATAASRPFRA